MSTQPNEQSQSPAPDQLTIDSLQQHLSPGVTNTIITNYTTVINNEHISARNVDQSAFAGLGCSEVSDSAFFINADEEAIEHLDELKVRQKAKLDAEHAQKVAQLMLESESNIGEPHSCLCHGT